MIFEDIEKIDVLFDPIYKEDNIYGVYARAMFVCSFNEVDKVSTSRKLTTNEGFELSTVVEGTLKFFLGMLKNLMVANKPEKIKNILKGIADGAKEHVTLGKEYFMYASNVASEVLDNFDDIGKGKYEEKYEPARKELLACVEMFGGIEEAVEDIGKA